MSTFEKLASTLKFLKFTDARTFEYIEETQANETKTIDNETSAIVDETKAEEIERLPKDRELVEEAREGNKDDSSDSGEDIEIISSMKITNNTVNIS